MTKINEPLMIMHSTDIEVIEAIKRGDVTAFREMYLRYADIIYRNILVRVNSSFDADDIFQDFFVKFWEKRETLQVESNVKAYLLTWLKHHVLNTIKENQIRLKYNESFSKLSEEADDYTWVKIVSSDLAVKLGDVVEKLPPRLRTVYVLSREQHLSVREIAEKLSVSEQTVKNQLSDILKRLKSEMSNKNFVFMV